MKNFYIKSGMILLIICMGFGIANVGAVSPLQFVPNNDPYRLIDTNLKYAVQNGSYFMWNNSRSVSMDMTTGSNETDVTNTNGTETDIGYQLQRFSSHTISNQTANLTVSQYRNNTNAPTIPMEFSEWDSDQINNITVNNTLYGLLQGQSYYPQDVYADDIMYEDSSLYWALMGVMGGDLEDNPLGLIPMILSIAENSSYASNFTVSRIGNETTVQMTNRYEGIYNITFFLDAIVNHLTLDDDGEDYIDNFQINASASILLHVKMNCYHVSEFMNIGMGIRAYVFNISNPLQFFNASMGMSMQNELIYMTLTDCAAGFELWGGNEVIDYIAMNWGWILIAIAGTVIAVIVIGLVVQGARCNAFTNPDDHLACRIRGYKKPQ